MTKEAHERAGAGGGAGTETDGRRRNPGRPVRHALTPASREPCTHIRPAAGSATTRRLSAPCSAWPSSPRPWCSATASSRPRCPVRLPLFCRPNAGSQRAFRSSQSAAPSGRCAHAPHGKRSNKSERPAAAAARCRCQSAVVSAVSGLEVATDNINNDVVIGVSCTILVLLFSFQFYGTHRVAAAFSPIVMLWLLANAAIGIYHLADNGATIFKARLSSLPRSLSLRRSSLPHSSVPDGQAARQRGFFCMALPAGVFAALDRHLVPRPRALWVDCAEQRHAERDGRRGHVLGPGPL